MPVLYSAVDVTRIPMVCSGNYFPKGQTFVALDGKRLAYIVCQLNNRARKIFACRTPSEVFNQAKCVALST
jgi:IS30 family transposase